MCAGCGPLGLVQSRPLLSDEALTRLFAQANTGNLAVKTEGGEMSAELSRLLVSAYTQPNSEDRLFFVVFTFVLPVIATVGLVGNVLSIVVLNNKAKFKSVIYIYLRGVALCDLLYMLVIINMCVVITVSDYRQVRDYLLSF